MFVTVEPGVTWAELDKALGVRGIRTPFRGPFSGLAATVGGSISQNALGLGTNTWGVSCESVLAMEVITADGLIIRTGQAGSKSGVPFFRHYGPDLTAVFTGDCGALGFKARITLKLMKARPRSGCLSFGFGTFEGAIQRCQALPGMWSKKSVLPSTAPCSRDRSERAAMCQRGLRWPDPSWPRRTGPVRGLPSGHTHGSVGQQGAIGRTLCGALHI